MAQVGGDVGVGTVQPLPAPERVSLAHHGVEVGERRNCLGICGLVVGDDGEPEPQLGEPNGGRVEVDPEEVPGQDAASRRGGRLVRPTRQRDEVIHCAEKECA